jgi:hypothetical protein
MNPAAIDLQNQIRSEASEGFTAWLSAANGALAVTTYQAGKLALIGWNGQQVSQFDKPLGLALQSPAVGKRQG